MKELKQTTTNQDGRVQSIEHMLNSVKVYTLWFKHTITDAIVIAVSTALIGVSYAIIKAPTQLSREFRILLRG